MAHTRMTNFPEGPTPLSADSTDASVPGAGALPTPGQETRGALTTTWDAASKRVARPARRKSVAPPVALLLSLVVHGLLLSLLSVGGEDFGLPGLALPWQERRVAVPGQRSVFVPVQLAPVRPAVEPAAALTPRAAVAQHGAGVPAARPPAPVPADRTGVAIAAAVRTAGATAPGAVPPMQVQTREPVADDVARVDMSTAVPPDVAVPPVTALGSAKAPIAETEPAAARRVDVVAQELAQEAVRVDAERQGAERQAQAERQAVARQEAARLEAVRLEAEHQAEAERQAAARSASQRQEAARIAAERQAAIERQAEAERQAAARLDAERQAQADRLVAARLAAQRQEAARQEAARQEATRQDVAREEALRLDAERRAEAERRAAARQETERRQAADAEAARLEAARRAEAQRQDAARLEAQRDEAARQQAARVDAARAAAERQADTTRQAEARREAVLRAIGRQLDEEAARRDAAAADRRQPGEVDTRPYSWSTARRVRLWGRTDPNVELVQYAEAWASKIQLNTPVESVRDLARRPHRAPMVTVAIRSDGSVESVSFVASSGVAEVDEAIRRIIEAQRPYLSFPPALASQYDVVEIRRTWQFDSAVRLH